MRWLRPTGLRQPCLESGVISPMNKLILVGMVVLGASAQAQTRDTNFNPTLFVGSGWYCSNDRTSASFCAREQRGCSIIRQRDLDQGRIMSPCTSARRAYCFTYENSEGSNGNCFPSMSVCVSHRRGFTWANRMASRYPALYKEYETSNLSNCHSVGDVPIPDRTP